MAPKKGVGSSRNGRESHSKRLGIKRFGGQAVLAGTKACTTVWAFYLPKRKESIPLSKATFALLLRFCSKAK